MSFRAKYSLVLLFIALLTHISILDLFYVNYSGPVFLWEENLQLKTILVHSLTALIATMSYVFFSFIYKDVKKGRTLLSDKVLIACSIALVFSIFFTIS